MTVREDLCRHPELRTLEETARHVLFELAVVVGVDRGTAIAKDETGREAVPAVESPHAGANVTRIRCAACGPRAYVCRLTERRVGANTATAVTGGNLSWPDCLVSRFTTGTKSPGMGAYA
jgi:hypothetical protein